MGAVGGCESLAATCSSASLDAVPSALRVFTAEFGMGSGVWPLAVTTRLSRPPGIGAPGDWRAAGLAPRGNLRM
jgi:hypothetical protein